MKKDPVVMAHEPETHRMALRCPASCLPFSFFPESFLALKSELRVGFRPLLEQLSGESLSKAICSQSGGANLPPASSVRGVPTFLWASEAPGGFLPTQELGPGA